MTDKQIIIDGVDVSRCASYIDNGECISEIVYPDYCKACSNCTYKLEQKLKRKEQECEELKEVNRHIEHSRTQKADKLMRIEKLITACSTGYTDEFIQELLVILHEPEPIKE